MSLQSVHFLLTYTCLYECDHCFLYCSPRSTGVFTVGQLEAALDQVVDAGVNSIYVEGGEAFLFYPVLLELLRMAKQRDLSSGVISNCYWAQSSRDAEIWLQPLTELGLSDFSVSDDLFHSSDVANSPAKTAFGVAKKLGLPVHAICMEPPTLDPEKKRDQAVVGGGILLKGRAVEKLADQVEKQDWQELDSCPHEELAQPQRVHLDPLGNVLVCQGISIGNIWEKPLGKMMEDYTPESHAIVGPLLRGGPAQLCRELGYTPESQYGGHCHLCFLARQSFLADHPATLCPPQVYGLDQG